MDFCRNKEPHPPHSFGTDFSECPGVAHDEDEVLSDGQTVGNALARARLTDKTKTFTPADYEHIAKTMMELSRAEAKAHEAQELENGCRTLVFSVADWITDRSDALGFIGDALSTMLKDRSTGTFTVELRVPKETP